VGREGVRSSGHPSGHVHEAAEDESASAKKPVNDQEARGDAAQTFPGPVEIDGQRSREGPGHPFRGNQHTGGIPGAHMAPDAGGGSGGGSHADYLQPLTSRGQGPITSKEVRRDYTKKSESLPKYLKRFGENFARRLAALGLPIHNIQVSDDGHSAYLHRKEKDFEVRITDHDPKRGTQPERPTIRYPFYLKGSTPRAKDLTDLLVKIASRHAP
jgi:hypothetical protein